MPALLQHEALIDQQLASLQTNGLAWVENHLNTILGSVFGRQAAAAAAQAQQGPRGIPGLGGLANAPIGTPAAGAAGQPNPYDQTNGQPAASAAGMVQGLWSTYGPSVIASGASLLRPTGASDPQQRGAAPAAAQTQSTSRMPRPQYLPERSSSGGPQMPQPFTSGGPQMPQPFVPPQKAPRSNSGRS